MIRIMDKMWLKDGFDLKMVTFGCVPTGDRQGMLELVTGKCYSHHGKRDLNKILSTAKGTHQTSKWTPLGSQITEN